jgi:hypothetical protein
MLTTTIDAPPDSVPKRIDLAAKQCYTALGLTNVKKKDSKSLELVLLQIVAGEIAHNAVFAQRAREACQQALASATKPASRTRSTASTAEKRSTPVRRVDPSRFSARVPIDPYAFWEQYGDEQFHEKLNGWHIDTLRAAAASVQHRNPGTKPKSKSRSVDLIDYIVRYVTGRQ